MGPIIGAAAVSGGSALAGGILQNRANAKEAARNRHFQKKMYRHRYQYTVEDMRKAGLNPALAYDQGAGSSPSGSTARYENVLGEAGGAAVQGLMTAAALKQQKAQTRLTNAQARQLEMESDARSKWWAERPENLRTQTLLSGGSWRVQNLTAEYLRESMGDRLAIAGLQREELQQLLVQLKQEIDLRGLERAPLEVQEKFAKSFVGSEVAPYLGTGAGMISALMSVVGPFLNFLGKRQGPNNRPNMRPQFRSKLW